MYLTFVRAPLPSPAAPRRHRRTSSPEARPCCRASPFPPPAARGTKCAGSTSTSTCRWRSWPRTTSTSPPPRWRKPRRTRRRLAPRSWGETVSGWGVECDGCPRVLFWGERGRLRGREGGCVRYVCVAVYGGAVVRQYCGSLHPDWALDHDTFASGRAASEYVCIAFPFS